MKPRILVVEDEPAIADTIRYALATDGFEPIVCATGAEALAAAGNGAVALAILDIGLPDINGFELFRRLRERGDLPVVFLTARSDEVDRVVGLELGADDYVAKPFSPRELVARVRTILRRSQRHADDAARGDGGAFGNPTARGPGPAASGITGSGTGEPTHDAPSESARATPAPTGPFAIDDEKRQIRYYGQLLALSRYEYGLLRVLVRRPGRVYTRDELLALVWDASVESIDRTVDAHVKTVRAKLKAVAPHEAIVTHRGTGYALAEDLPASR